MPNLGSGRSPKDTATPIGRTLGAIATRAIMADLRAGMEGPLSGSGGGPLPFRKEDSSRILQALDMECGLRWRSTGAHDAAKEVAAREASIDFQELASDHNLRES